MNAKVLTEIDQKLHDAIHAEMMSQNASDLLSNPRIKVFKRLKPILGELSGYVCDVGCGSGYISIWLALNHPRIKCIDAVEASALAVEQLIPRNIKYHNVDQKVTAKLGSFDDLGSEKYDYVVVMGALHHSINLERALESIAKSLKPRGVLIAQEPAMPDHTTHKAFRDKYNIVEERYGLKIRNGERYDRFFRECEYKSAIVKSGLDLIAFEDWISKSSWVTRIVNEIRQACSKQGMFEVFNFFIRNLEQRFRSKNNLRHNGWRQQMALATVDLRGKLIVARKSEVDEIYHDD